MNLAELENAPIDDRIKGIPGGTPPFPLGTIGAQNWNLLREDLPLPVVALKDSALAHNSAWMRRFVQAGGAALAPHGKTTMSPQLFKRQLDDGAWAITLATVGQLQVARRYGVPRVLFANQLVGRPAIRYVLDELRRDPGFDFYALADSVAGVRRLAEAARAHPPGRPLRLLVEGGFAGGRTGCRTLDSALEVARAVKDAAPALALHGVEGFEGIIAGPDPAATADRVSAFLDFLVAIARACAGAALFADGPVILSAGGSAFYDLVVERFAGAGLGRETKTVIRAGCYLTHDSIMYRELFRRIAERAPAVRRLGEGLRPALELWAYVQSRPESTRAILGFGKRDSSYDAGLPAPQAWFRPGSEDGPRPLGPDHMVVAINDQHAFLDLPAASPLRVGDMVALGLSHPCLIFDKWQLLPVVDDDYNVVSAIRTFF